MHGMLRLVGIIVSPSTIMGISMKLAGVGFRTAKRNIVFTHTSLTCVTLQDVVDTENL